MLFNTSINTAIDTIQNAKHTFVDTFVKNEEIKKPLKTYVNAQSEYAKKVISDTANFWTVVCSSAASVDYTKAFSSK
jgi:hypothetical protein